MNVRTIFGVLAWMMSSTLDANEVGSTIAISADADDTTYLLSEVQSVNVPENDSIDTMYLNSKKGKSQRVNLPSVSTKLGNVEVPNIYIYPNPVSTTIYVSGVDEDETLLVVYDLFGHCLLGEYGNVINVTPLETVIYILCINNQFVKFVKK